MANRAINSTGSTPAGYDSGHTTLNAAITAGANSDDFRWTEGFITTEAVNTVLTDIDIGVDNQTGTGIADIAHTGSGVWDTGRAGIINGGTPLRANAGVVRVEWMQTQTTSTSQAACYFSTSGSNMICKNCLAWSDGRQAYGFHTRTQTGVSEADCHMECHYCLATMNNHISAGGAGFYAWNHTTTFEPTITCTNCATIGLTDAVNLGLGFLLQGATAAVITITATNCQFYGAAISQVLNAAPQLLAGAGGVGNNASTFDEETTEGPQVDFGTTKWVSDTVTDWYQTPSGGLGADLTPLFPERRIGTDNKANAALDDNGVNVDFRKIEIKTFNIGPFDEGIEITGRRHFKSRFKDRRFLNTEV